VQGTLRRKAEVGSTRVGDLNRMLLWPGAEADPPAAGCSPSNRARRDATARHQAQAAQRTVATAGVTVTWYNDTGKGGLPSPKQHKDPRVKA